MEDSIAHSSGRDATRTSMRSTISAVIRARDGVTSAKYYDEDTEEWLNPKRNVCDLSDDAPAVQKILWRIVSSPAYDSALGVLICFNVFLIIMETDLHAEVNHDPVEWLAIASYVFMSVYILDCAARIYVHRSQYFCGGWNLLDFTLVVIDLFLMVISIAASSEVPSLAFFRVLRLLRLMRFLRVLRQFKELDFMLYGLVSASKAIFWSMLMLAIVLTIFSIVIVQVLHPILVELIEEGVYEGCTHCQYAFDTVMQCNLHLVHTVIAGDSWGELSLPLIQHRPELAGPLMIFALLAIHLGLMNLVLTVIVNAAQTAYDADIMRKMQSRQKAFENTKHELLNICESIDRDASGFLTLEEIKQGYDSSGEFKKHMNILDLGQEDVDVIFKVLDEDHSGTVSYKEFVEQLYKMKTKETHSQLIFMQGIMQDVRIKLAQQIHLIKTELLETTSEVHHKMQHMVASGTTTVPSNPGGLVDDFNVQAGSRSLPVHMDDGAYELEVRFLQHLQAKLSCDTGMPELPDMPELLPELPEAVAAASKKDYGKDDWQTASCIKNGKPKDVEQDVQGRHGSRDEAIAYACERLVENPLETWKHCRERSSQQPAPTSLTDMRL